MHCSDVFMFMSLFCVTWFEKRGTELVEALTSGYPQDPKKVCLTGTVCFQECFSQGVTRGVRDG